MPPKLSLNSANKTRQSKEAKQGEDSTATSQPNRDESPIKAQSPPKRNPRAPKRSADELSKKDTSTKVTRRSSRGVRKPSPSSAQVLNQLLSDAALPLCSSPDETSNNSESERPLKTWSGGVGVMTPFEELLGAAILSRPISHRLGARTIRTVLNSPYAFVSAKAIRDAGGQRVHDAVWAARTQHKDKTVEGIETVAEIVGERFVVHGDWSDTSLQAVLDQAGEDNVQAQRDLLKKSIKGVGETAMNIFYRRVQWRWPAAYPFVDKRTKEALEEFGLPTEGLDLDQLIRDSWSDLKIPKLEERDDDAKRRTVFVIVLERVLGAHFEGNVEQIRRDAEAS